MSEYLSEYSSLYPVVGDVLSLWPDVGEILSLGSLDGVTLSEARCILEKKVPLLFLLLLLFFVDTRCRDRRDGGGVGGGSG